MKNENNNNNKINFTNKYKNISNDDYQKNINEFDYIDSENNYENVIKFDQKSTNKKFNNINKNNLDYNESNLINNSVNISSYNTKNLQHKNSDKYNDKINDEEEEEDPNTIIENNNNFNIINVGNENSIFQNLEENYINASCLDGGPLERDKGMFIATQGPLKKTIRKFWKLVLQKGVVTVIMLCREIEDLRVSFF